MTFSELATGAALASPMIAAVGLFLAWRVQRENQLRRSEVLDWASRAIRVLQTLALRMQRRGWADGSEGETLEELGVEASVLVEQGRMFFKNKRHRHGIAKPPAYRGLRPEILDKLVVACAAAWKWPSANQEEQRRLAYLVAEAEQWFVSFAQMEVGRSRTASADASRAGNGVNIDLLIREVDGNRLAQWERSTSTRRSA